MTRFAFSRYDSLKKKEIPKNGVRTFMRFTASEDMPEVFGNKDYNMPGKRETDNVTEAA